MHAFRTCKQHDRAGQPNPYYRNSCLLIGEGKPPMKVAHRACPLLFAASALLLACGGDDSGSGTFDNSSGTATGGSMGSGGASSHDGSVGFGGSFLVSQDSGGTGQIVLE